MSNTRLYFSKVKEKVGEKKRKAINSARDTTLTLAFFAGVIGSLIGMFFQEGKRSIASRFKRKKK